MSSFRGLARMVVPSATVFFSSGCLVILVLTGFRLVARHLGSSLYTWTAILSIVLAGMAVGNYLGGRIADRYHSRRALSVLFGLSSAACVGVLIVNNVAGQWMGLWRLGWPEHVFIHALLVFLLPSCLLGAIIPVVTKTTIEKAMVGPRGDQAAASSDLAAACSTATGRSGRMIGSIYAWSAAGGIAATLLIGFFPATSNALVLWLTGAALLAMAILYWISCWALYLWAMIFAALATMGMAPAKWAQGAGTTALLREPPDPNVFYVDQTPYGYVAVRQTSRRPDGREFVQDKLRRNEAVMRDVTQLKYFYTKVYAGLTQGLIADKGKPSMLVIGGGGYAFPRYLKALWPGSVVEVVEPDPDATRAAEALGLEHNSATIKTIHTDARNYVDGLLRQEYLGGGARRYDFIYEDAFNDYAVPFPLVTREFHDKVSQLLADDGVYMVNLIDTYENGQLLGAVVNTLEQTFPNVYAVAGRGGLPLLRNSFVVVAATRRLDIETILHKYDEHLQFRLLNESEMGHLKDACGGIILTDDYAPVEHLLAPVVRQSAKTILVQKYLDKARVLQNEGRSDLRHAWELPRGGSPDPSAAMRNRGIGECEQSIEQYRKAIELDPSLSIEACNEIGLTLIEQNKLEEAVRAFHSAIDYHQRAGLQDAAIAPVYRNLGMLLRRLRKNTEGNAELAQAAKWFRIETEENPRSVVAWEQLGGVLAMRENMKEASQAFEKALALEPGNLSHYEKLARTLEHQKRYGEAIEVVRRQMKLLEDRHDRAAATQARQYLELLEYQRAKQPH